MSRFNKYFLMKADDVKEYVLEKVKDIPFDESSINVEEIGDGNLNYVFRVKDKFNHSIIIKHAGEALRISEEMKVSTDRNRIESEILLLQEKYVKGMVPHIYFYDKIMCACAMEDLSDYKLMRYALMNGEIFPKFADDISEFIVKTLFMTSDLCMDHKEKKELVKNFISPELCEISENLVLMEPYNNINKQNSFMDENEKFINKELYEDENLGFEVAKLKFKFMNEAQALIHGDLHTGSIFVKEDSTKIFDPEFAFYGPIGYDLGNVIANLIFAYGKGLEQNNNIFNTWVLNTIEEIIDKFIEKFYKYYDKLVTEPMAKVKCFKEDYLKKVLEDTAGYAGTELHRRTVGMAKIKDLTSVENKDFRAYLERLNILCGKEFILYKDKFISGKEFAKAVNEATIKAK